MEYTIGECQESHQIQVELEVLILIYMEYTIGETCDNWSDTYMGCLNPYLHGIYYRRKGSMHNNSI